MAKSILKGVLLSGLQQFINLKQEPHESLGSYIMYIPFALYFTLSWYMYLSMYFIFEKAVLTSKQIHSAATQPLTTLCNYWLSNILTWGCNCRWVYRWVRSVYAKYTAVRSYTKRGCDRGAAAEASTIGQQAASQWNEFSFTQRLDSDTQLVFVRSVSLVSTSLAWSDRTASASACCSRLCLLHLTASSSASTP